MSSFFKMLQISRVVAFFGVWGLCDGSLVVGASAGAATPPKELMPPRHQILGREIGVDIWNLGLNLLCIADVLFRLSRLGQRFVILTLPDKMLLCSCDRVRGN